MVSQTSAASKSKKTSPFTIISKIAKENGIEFSGKVVLPIKDSIDGSFRNIDTKGKDFVSKEELNQSYFKTDNSVGLGDQDNQYRNSGC